VASGISKPQRFAPFIIILSAFLSVVGSFFFCSQLKKIFLFATFFVSILLRLTGCWAFQVMSAAAADRAFKPLTFLRDDWTALLEPLLLPVLPRSSAPHQKQQPAPEKEQPVTLSDPELWRADCDPIRLIAAYCVVCWRPRRKVSQLQLCLWPLHLASLCVRACRMTCLD
jgi:hypothetical protein